MRWMLILLALNAGATTYYVDGSAGSDANAGTAPAAAWKSLGRVAAADFRPGDRILLKSGSAWHEQLRPHSSGAEGAPIVIGRYGEGPMPRIDAEGRIEDAVLLQNVQQIELRDLEITNRGEQPGVRRGVHIYLDNFGTASHIVVAGLYIHDVNGSNQKKDNGGIIFRTNGDRVPSRFDGLTIERNIVWKVDRSAIAAQSYHWRRTQWFPSLHVVIRDNYVDDIGGDGIVPWATDGARIEHNIARNCNRRAASYNAGIWPWSTDNSLFEWNEAAFTRTTMDGQGFDSDFNSRGTVFQYNYSHDNEGGFMLICSPGRRNTAENLGNTGTIVRRNISRNDRARIFHISAVEHTTVEENAIYVGPGLDVQMVLMTDWSGWAEDTRITGNRFYIEGSARSGHAASKRPDGSYELAEGWGPAKGTIVANNQTTSKAPKRNWDGPAFDPAHPEGFDKFLTAHRAWMKELMDIEFRIK